MKRPVVAALLALATGCAVGPQGAEQEREVVLQYLGGDAPTAGPFGRQGKNELAVLSEKDRAAALDLLERGAAGFSIYGRAPAAAANAEGGDAARVVRVVLVQHGRVVGDFAAAP